MTSVATCSDVTVTVDSLSETSSITINGDGTYSSPTGSESVTFTYSIPSSCLMAGGVTLTCDQLGAALMGTGDAGTTGSCTTTASGCDCKLMSMSMVSGGAGTYTTMGNSFTTTTTDDAGTTSTTDQYCVSGNTLYVFPEPVDGGTTLAGEVVFTKQ